MSTAVAAPQSQILHGMAGGAYYSKLALSQSGMKDLAVSPLYYWHRNINPNRPIEEPTPEQKFGTALHCLVLEGRGKFNECYAPMLNEEEYPDALRTIDELRAWIKDKGHTPKGTRKADVITQAKGIDPTVQIWDELCAQHEAETSGKMLCLPEDWERLNDAAESLLSEKKFVALLKDGEPEVSLFTSDPDTQVPQKCRIDWLNPRRILDLKTFTLRRGKSVDECVADAIWYEGYSRQAYYYSILHQRVTEAARPLKFVFAFVQSEPPYEVRLRELAPTNYDIAALNLYWQKAQIEVQHFCRIWRDCMLQFGKQPWRTEREIEPLDDLELKGLVR